MTPLPLRSSVGLLLEFEEETRAARVDRLLRWALWAWMGRDERERRAIVEDARL